MLSRTSLLGRLGGEEGSMIVVAGIIVVSLAMLSGFVLQVGDWLEHRRSAQVRADAAALAGGQLFGQCFDTATAAQASYHMHELAKQYAGYASSFGNPLNKQFGGGSTTQPLFASKTYPGGGGGGPDDTVTGDECSSMALDVKLTDANIPALMSIFPQATIHAHARVQAQSIQSYKGAFPLAIPDVEPKYIAATFVDESSGAELTGCGTAGLLGGTTCTYLLGKGATANNVTSWAASVSPNLPSGVTAALGKRIGVRIGMGAVTHTCANYGGNDNWACFDGTTSSQGALMLRDYAAGSGGASQPNNKPILRAVYPTNSCAPAFAPQFGTSPFLSDAGGVATCAVGAGARIDFGTGNVNPTNAAPGGVKAKATVTINGNAVTLSPVAGSYDAATTTWLWTPSAGSATVPVSDAGATSSYPVTIAWEEQDGMQGATICKTSGNPNACKGTFDGGAAVARITSATSDDEGPIKLMSVTQGGTAAYSLTPGIKTVDLEIRIQGSLGVVNPPVLQALRLARTTTPGVTTAIECDGPGNKRFTDAIITGCQTPYQINSSQVCPDPSPPAGPADCVPTKPGNLGNSVVKALDTRFAGCPTNNWPDYTKTGDPRVIVTMLTDFSAYSKSGKTQVPVVNFAAFYVIGWSGNNCGAAWPFPGSEPNGGNIWGYFIKYASLNQVPNGTVCDPTQVTPCVPVLVR